MQANYLSASKQQGAFPAGLQREFERINQSRIDWRKELWKFVSKRQSDFTEFDNRHIHRGLYLEELYVDALNMVVAVDTSGSVSDKQLGIFIRELTEIQKLHADVNIKLYYCDTHADGPHDLGHEKFAPTGGGGTSFVPVFDKVDELELTDKPDCLVYFTDGFGEFPEQPPSYPTLWLLVDDGIPVSDVPWGRAICMPYSGDRKGWSFGIFGGGEG